MTIVVMGRDAGWWTLTTQDIGVAACVNAAAKGERDALHQLKESVTARPLFEGAGYPREAGIQRSLRATERALSTGLSRYDSTVLRPVRISTSAVIPGMMGSLPAMLDARVRTRTR